MLFKVLIQVNVYVKFTIIWQLLISKYENILLYIFQMRTNFPVLCLMYIVLQLEINHTYFCGRIVFVPPHGNELYRGSGTIEISVSEVYWRLLNWWRVPLTYCLPWVFIITDDETNKKTSSFISTERHFYRQLLLRPTVDNTPLLNMWCGKANWFWFI